jgi:hypothetical protein
LNKAGIAMDQYHRTATPSVDVVEPSPVDIDELARWSVAALNAAAFHDRPHQSESQNQDNTQ